MSDINRIEGPSGPPPNAPRRERTTPDAEKFKKQMSRKVEKVDETDSEQQKKRKRPEEVEPEEPSDEASSETTPDEEIAPFSLEPQTQEPSPFDVQTPESKTPSSEKAAPSDGNIPPTPLSLPTSQSKPAEDTTVSRPEKVKPIEPVRAGSETEAKMGEPAPTPRIEAPEHAQVEIQARSEKPEPSINKPDPAREKKDKTTDRLKSRGILADETSSMQDRPKEDVEALFETKDKEEPLEEQEGAAPAGLSGVMGPSHSLRAHEARLANERKQAEWLEKRQIKEEAMPILPSDAPTEIADAPSDLTPAPPYTQLSSQLLDVYERMVGLLTVMHSEGISETTVTLDSPQFASSVFYQTQIIIREYSTAPKAFNIQINATPQAVDVFKGGANDLMAAFQHGNYHFRVNRLETGYLQ